MLFALHHVSKLLSQSQLGLCCDPRDKIILTNATTKKTKISEGYLVRENVKSLSNSVTKFCD